MRTTASVHLKKDTPVTGSVLYVPAGDGRQPPRRQPVLHVGNDVAIFVTEEDLTKFEDAIDTLRASLRAAP